MLISSIVGLVTTNFFHKKLVGENTNKGANKFVLIGTECHITFPSIGKNEGKPGKMDKWKRVNMKRVNSNCSAFKMVMKQTGVSPGARLKFNS